MFKKCSDIRQWFPRCARQTPRDPQQFRGISGYISVMTTFKFTCFLIKGIMFFKSIQGTLLIGDMFICMTFRISN